MTWSSLKNNRTEMTLKNSKMIINLCYWDRYPDKCSVTCKKISYSKMFTAHSLDEAKKIAEELIIEAIRNYQEKLELVIREIEADKL